MRMMPPMTLSTTPAIRGSAFMDPDVPGIPEWNLKLRLQRRQIGGLVEQGGLVGLRLRADPSARRFEVVGAADRQGRGHLAPVTEIERGEVAVVHRAADDRAPLAGSDVFHRRPV